MRVVIWCVVLFLCSVTQAQTTVEQAMKDPRSIWYSHATLPPVYESSGTIHHVGYNLGVPGEDKTGTANNEKPWLHTGGFDLVDRAKVTIKRLLWIPPKTKIVLTNMAGRSQNRIENGVQVVGRSYTRISGVFPNGTLVAEFVLDGTEMSLTRSRQKLDGEWVTDEEVHGKLPQGYVEVESCTKCHEDIGQHSIDLDPSREWYATIRGLEVGGPIHWHPFVWPARRDGSVPAAIRADVSSLITWSN